MMKSQPMRSFGPTEKAVAKERVSDNQWIGRANITDMTRVIGEGEEQREETVVGMKQWVEARYDHEPTQTELNELAESSFE